ncbi:SDR family NAD(P)-dependent oxidoreductase [Chelativorans salis]|uniref:SDR family NAD(P)-dependent oxidoreductase n=1 Tax=Chelativorans salis TaxID=2978478 RepID=A0ABT2LMC7_9HYPH|nr:SDR family NAD(P)-dependent oxidoreductase [Chelativorans sp. EGI FJ00035]MCT7374982.1 SDR family NAD(P)-dependent oxidoreductase [Chelativorans sp. EGI FJ00035]
MSVALIVGVGDGLSASLARKLAARGYRLVFAARNIAKLGGLAAETKAVTVACDASQKDDVAALFEQVDEMGEALEIAIYNPSARARGPFIEIDPDAVQTGLQVTAFGAFLVAQQAARRMLPRGHGAIFFTGASAGVKGFPQSASFAMGKFALRGLAQSLARELHPKGVHIGHVVVDGAIRNPGRTEPPDRPDSMLDPDAIAETYMQLLEQDRSAWSWEIEVRPWVETF